MLTLAIILAIFGILPVAISLLIGFFGPPKFLGIPNRQKPTFQAVSSWYEVPQPTPWSNLGGSAIRLLSGVARYLTGRSEPQFSTLGCQADQVSGAKWRLAVEFQLFNPPHNREVVFDDLHTRLFERNAHAPPLLTISFYGDVWLRQDNSILRNEQIYSLPPGDGYIINLILEATRIEAAPAYGMNPHEKEGSVAVVFGLLLDYYFQSSSGLDRRTIPSDRIYLFTYSHRDQEATLRGIDHVELESIRSQNSGNAEAERFLERVEKYLVEHLSFRPEPTT